MHKVRRICAGEYYLTWDRFPGKSASISKVYHSKDNSYYWMFNLNFSSVYSEPLLTKNDAINVALRMMEIY